MKKYLSAVILTALSGMELQAQTLQPAPKLVVNITIDQLRTDYIEHYAPLLSQNGLKKLLQQGCVYEAAAFPFEPVDRASAIAAIATGTTPYYNNITGAQWLDRNTLRPVFCVDDSKYKTSPANLATSTIGDEMKIASAGVALVYAIAEDPEAAVLSAGHAADGAVWIDGKTGQWTTSDYYPKTTRDWLNAYSSIRPQPTKNGSPTNGVIGDLALDCINQHAMGQDNVTDYLAITLSAKPQFTPNNPNDTQSAYVDIDKTLAKVISRIEQNIGKANVLFMLTGTGYAQEANIDYSKYRVPSGTFYINRTANLLNMYLGALYGQGKYVEACYRNQLYLNRKFVEQQRLSLSEIVRQSIDFLKQNSGVKNAEPSLADPAVSGDITVEVAPGWQLLNEDTQENYTVRASGISFPIIFYGATVKHEVVTTPTTADRIAPTIAKAIQIRAPNACKAQPLR